MHKIVEILLLWTCLLHSKEYASDAELTSSPSPISTISTLPTPTFMNASNHFYNSHPELMQTGDTDIVQAPQQLTRNSRQLFYDPSLFFLPNYNVEGSKCYTSRGTTGVCVRFSGCRTYYRFGSQITFVNLRQWPQSVAVNDEICSFYDLYGRANSGICCTIVEGGNDFGFGIVPAQPPTFVPGPVRPIPSPPPVDGGSDKDNTNPNPDRDREEIDHSTDDDDGIDSSIDIDGNNIQDSSPDFQDENNVGYDPIKDDGDELPTPVAYDDRYPWSTQQFGGHFGGYPQWPPPVPTHPPSSAVWPPPIPTHPPNHHYPTHPATATKPTTRPTTRPTSIPTTITTTRRSSTTTTTRRPITTTTTRRPSYPSYPGFPSYPSYPGSPSYPTYPRPPQTTTTTTRRPPAQAPPASSTPVGGSTSNGLPQQCGIKNPVSPDQERIVGGTNASPHEFPWIAVLFKSGKQFCGGSLITHNHILTAAHCVARMTSWDVAALTAHLGDYNIRTDFEVQHVLRRIKRLVRHKGFDFSTLHNDIAILTLSEPVKFTYEIQPICLPTSSSQQGRSYSGQLATVAGWGSLRENGPQPSILQKVQIPIWSNIDCARKYGRAAPAGIIESMLCAGQASKDSCSGDSGGPMIVNEGGRYTQVGIVSWGIGCGKGEYPGVYTRVTSLLPWIYKNIK